MAHYMPMDSYCTEYNDRLNIIVYGLYMRTVSLHTFLCG